MSTLKNAEKRLLLPTLTTAHGQPVLGNGDTNDVSGLDEFSAIESARTLVTTGNQWAGKNANDWRNQTFQGLP